MFVKSVTADEWDSRTNHGSRISKPKWEQVVALILAMDGKRRTLVGLSDKEGSDHYMLVAGKWDGRYLVNATKDNMAFVSLIDTTRPTQKKLLYVGGQDGEFDEQKCVPLSWALEAAEHFYLTGEMKSTMNWASDY